MNQARMPETYPERIRLNDELHARPPVALWPNEHILYLALVNTSGKRLQEEVIIRDLCDSLGGTHARRYRATISNLTSRLTVMSARAPQMACASV